MVPMDAKDIRPFLRIPLQPSFRHTFIVLILIVVPAFFRISDNLTLLQMDHPLLHRIDDGSIMGRDDNRRSPLVDSFNQLNNLF